MRLGISSYTFTWAIGVPGNLPPHPMSGLDLLNTAAELGVGVVQIADNLPLDQLPAEELEAMATRAQALHLNLEIGTRGIELAHLRAYLALAQRYRSPLLRVVVDTASHHPDPEEVIQTLKTVAPDLERLKITLAIENHNRFSAKTLATIIKRVRSPWVGICLDTVNSFGALEGPEVVLAALGRWVVNLHVKDFSIQRASHMMGFTIEGQPAGQGRLNIPGLLENLKRLGRNPNAILELWTPPEASLALTMAKEAEWAKASVEYLRGLIRG